MALNVLSGKAGASAGKPRGAHGGCGAAHSAGNERGTPSIENPAHNWIAGGGFGHRRYPVDVAIAPDPACNRTSLRFEFKRYFRGIIAFRGAIVSIAVGAAMVLPVGGALVLDRIPGFEDVITMEIPPGFLGLEKMDPVDLLGSILMLVLVLVALGAWIMLSVLLTTGAGALAAKYRSQGNIISSRYPDGNSYS